MQSSKGAAPTVKLNSGFDMPVLGLGTWTLRGKVAEDAVYVAIKNGYRLIDTAKYYDNEGAGAATPKMSWGTRLSQR